MATLQQLTGGYQAIQQKANNASASAVANQNYNAAASAGKVYGPVNPNSGLSQPTGATGSTSGGGGVSSAPVQSNNQQAPMIPQPNQPNIDFNALIQPALDALDQAIAPLQNANAADIQSITDSAAQQKADTNQNIAGQTSTINQAQTQQKTNENSAADEARRQFSEVQQGLQARYGGTTGTGAFATEYAGGNAIRSIANIHTAAAQAQQALTDKLLQVQEVGRTALQNIETNAQDLIGKAKANLDVELSSIRQQKGNLLANKAQMAADAMQKYQDTVNQVNAQNTQFKQQLFVQQQAAQQTLQNKLQSAQAITNAATPQDLIALAKQYQVAGYDVSGTQNPTTGGGSINFSTGKNSNSASVPTGTVDYAALGIPVDANGNPIKQ